MTSRNEGCGLYDDGVLFSDYELLHKEAKRQVAKWGNQDHHPFKWLAIITEELGELAQAINEYFSEEGSKEKIVEEAIQTATLALKIAVMARDQLK